MTGTRHRILDGDTPGMEHCHGMVNINGPSVIRRPDWVDLPGRYLLYFAHHCGSHIRLAHADHLAGPWTLHEGGVLHIDDTPAAGPIPHVASPDVHEVDGRLRMYFHCLFDDDANTGQPFWGNARGYLQGTLIAESTDGVRFTLRDDTVITSPYLRMIRRPDAWYGISMQDWLWRSPDGLTGWEHRRVLSDDIARHVGLDLVLGGGVGDRLDVYFTSFVDPPERIKRRSIELTDDWTTWTPGQVEEVLRPVEAWEGADLEVTDSFPGPTPEPQHALRDPFVFRDDDGSAHLFYAAAGEFAMGVTALS
ncbi:MAG: hypothetical protein R8F63_15795 [Acidimicrobiales bacterium]|nr:hypothetical protein [Acidimicrobiales bacterium]